jgi:hypothetical protein
VQKFDFQRQEELEDGNVLLFSRDSIFNHAFTKASAVTFTKYAGGEVILR